MASILDAISTALYSYILIILLIGTGLYFFIRTKALPLRMFWESIRVVMEKPEKDSDFSSFRALMISTASRVGVGNIAGVGNGYRAGRCWCSLLDVGYRDRRLGLGFHRINPGSDL